MEDEEARTPTDFLGQEVSVGDCVIAAQGHDLALYKVIKITPKMIRIVRFGAKTRSAQKGKLRYGRELLKVDDSLVTFHLMRQ